jgi:hypothetical protein
MRTLKNEIKKLAEDQLYLKDQRKSDKIVGERKLQTWEAAMQHTANRHKLRIMYAAYGLMRGKSFSQTESFYPETDHPLNQFKSQIDNLILQHTGAL